MAQSSSSQLSPPLLTPRQLEVLELMAKGLSNREIARVLGIAAATVKRHVSSVIETLDVSNRTEAATALHELGLGTGRAPTAGHAVPGFGARPSIAVMPFENLSHDAEHAHLADAIVEDVITRLSGWRWFPVIARSSTWAYKGRAVDVREVNRALGADFLVSGSVRPVGETVRITVSLVDGASGEQVWAHRYDRELARVFELENEIVDTIVASLEPALVRLQGLRHLPHPPENLGAWELLNRGFLLVAQGSWDELRAAGPLFDRAAELEPGLALASAGRSVFEIFKLIQQRGGEPEAEVEARALHLAEEAVARDANEPMAQMALGWSLLFARQPERGLGPLEHAIDLNPSLTWAHWGRGTALWVLDADRVEEGIAALERAIRLSPQDPFLHFMLSFRAIGQLAAGRFDEAQASLERSRHVAPGEPHACPLLAICLVLRGELDQARAQIARMREIHPTYSPLLHARRFSASRSLDDYVALLAEAGWQEPDPVGSGSAA